MRPIVGVLSLLLIAVPGSGATGGDVAFMVMSSNSSCVYFDPESPLESYVDPDRCSQWLGALGGQCFWADEGWPPVPHIDTEGCSQWVLLLGADCVYVDPEWPPNSYVHLQDCPRWAASFEECVNVDLAYVGEAWVADCSRLP